MSVKRKKTLVPAVIVFLLPFLLNSCLGIDMDISLNRNGSGTVALEYRISSSLDSLGRLDGNERWNTIPAGKADLERSLDRLPGMKLLSFSSKDEGKNLVIKAKMEFENILGLLAFLDAGGRRSSFSGDGQSGRLAVTLNEGVEIKNSALYGLIEDVSRSYSVRMAMNFPGEGSLVITDSQGKPLNAIPGGEINAAGRKVFFSFPLYEVLSAEEGIKAEFLW